MIIIFLILVDILNEGQAEPDSTTFEVDPIHPPSSSIHSSSLAHSSTLTHSSLNNQLSYLPRDSDDYWIIELGKEGRKKIKFFF